MVYDLLMVNVLEMTKDLSCHMSNPVFLYVCLSPSLLSL